MNPALIIVPVILLGALLLIGLVLIIRVADLCRQVEAMHTYLLHLKETLKPATPPLAAPRPKITAPLSTPATTLAVSAKPQAPIQADQANEECASPNALERLLAKAWNWLIVGDTYRKPGESWEVAAASHWLLRIGILIVLGGVAFFLKYSIEKGLLGPTARVALALITGVALIAGGLRLFFKRYHLIGQGLAGTGFIMLYFAFYASTTLYDLTSPVLAFVLTAGVTIAAGILSVTYRSLPLALLGVVGGYLTPLMFGTTDASPHFTYGYLILLGSGIMGVSLIRSWPLLNALGMLASYGIIFLINFQDHHTHHLLLGLIYTSAVHLLFLLSIITTHLRRGLKTTLVQWGALSLNAALYWVWINLLFEPLFGRQGSGLVALAVAAVYIMLATGAIRRQVFDRKIIALFIAWGAFFLVLTPFFILGKKWITVAWAIQALTMLWLAQRTAQPTLARASTLLFALACARGFIVDIYHLYTVLTPWLLSGSMFWHATGTRFLVLGALPLTLLGAWHLIRGQRYASKLLGLILFQLWLLLTMEASLIARVYNHPFQNGAVTLTWMVFAFGLLFSGIRLRGRWLRWCGLTLFAMAVLKLLISDLADLESLYRIIAFITSGVLLVLGAFLYLHYKNLFEDEPLQEPHNA